MALITDDQKAIPFFFINSTANYINKESSVRGSQSYLGIFLGSLFSSFYNLQEKAGGVP